jgi:L-seryl-tRNA(Ser) seleniumtransferase
LSPHTGVILKVHTSNYRILGFTAEVGAAEISAIADEASVALINDLGSGTLVDLSIYGLQQEPTVREAVAQGAGLVTFSGDKLLGGPQAGFIVGRKALIDKIRLAAIEATLKLYRDPDRLAERLPTLRWLARPKAEIEATARRLRPVMAQCLGDGYTVELCDCQSEIGSGALPLDAISSAGLVIRSASGGAALDRLAAAFRRLKKPVIGHISDGGFTLDLRCLADEKGFAIAISELDVRTPT